MKMFVETVLNKDDNNSSDTFEWIQCDSCLLWMYLTRTIPKLDALLDNYI